LKEGEHHNFICIGSGKVFAGDRTPLQQYVVWDKVIHNEPTNLAFIYNGCLKQVRVGGRHGWEEELLRPGIEVTERRRSRGRR
jgi:hypothetical protein